MSAVFVCTGSCEGQKMFCDCETLQRDDVIFTLLDKSYCDEFCEQNKVTLCSVTPSSDYY